MKFIKTTLSAAILSLVLVGCNQDKPSTKTDSSKTSENHDASKSDGAPLNNHPAQSSDPNHQPDIATALQENLNKSNIDVHVVSVVPTEMPDLYWATIDGGTPVFVDKSGKYIIDGTVVELGGTRPVDITVKMQSANARVALAQVDTSQMIIYPAKGETKAVLYVFTDPTCHYCQKLHEEIDDTNAQGVEIRYLAWPRGEQLMSLAESVWCSEDRKDAITRAKKGEKITAPECDNPVAKHMMLGHHLGVTGTPAVFAENGVRIGGYLPSDELVKTAILNKE